MLLQTRSAVLLSFASSIALITAFEGTSRAVECTPPQLGTWDSLGGHTELNRPSNAAAATCTVNVGDSVLLRAAMRTKAVFPGGQGNVDLLPNAYVLWAAEPSTNGGLVARGSSPATDRLGSTVAIRINAIGTNRNITSATVHFDAMRAGTYRIKLVGSAVYQNRVGLPGQRQVYTDNGSTSSTPKAIWYTITVVDPGFPPAMVGTTFLTQSYAFRDAGVLDYLENGTSYDRSPEAYAFKVNALNADGSVSVSMTEMTWDATNNVWAKPTCMATSTFDAQLWPGTNMLSSGPALVDDLDNAGGHFPLGRKSIVNGVTFEAMLNATHDGFEAVNVYYGQLDAQTLNPIAGGDFCASLDGSGSGCGQCAGADRQTCFTPTVDLGPTVVTPGLAILPYSDRPASYNLMCMQSLSLPFM